MKYVEKESTLAKTLCVNCENCKSDPWCLTYDCYDKTGKTPPPPKGNYTVGITNRTGDERYIDGSVAKCEAFMRSTQSLIQRSKGYGYGA
ncbi:MAG: hypothetical protein FWD15_01075 [Alphaproteobacteria bacterium]|nr:hypothetical protein [Alphaproteobacteria bacterium]